jgi:hypothetical protein
MQFLRTGLLLLSTSVLLLANPYESNEEELASVVQTGQKASTQLLKTLGSNLQKHMKEGGPIKAAEFCITNAYPLTDKVSSDLGTDVSVKRVSLKYRNPANAPLEDETVVLNALESLQKEGVILPEYLVKHVDKETYKYYKPLNINKGVCLKCHGVIDNPELSAKIAKTYPGDKATGYKLGDLRGAIVVTIKK